MTDLDSRIRALAPDTPLLGVEPAAMAAAARKARRRKTRRAGAASAIAACALAVTGAALSLGQGGDRLSTVAGPERADAPSPPPVTFDVRWDDPTRGEGGALTDEAGLPQLSRAALGREVPPPRLGAPARLIRVSGSAGNLGTVAFVYDFGRTTEFPTDGRVRVLVTEADIASSELDRMARETYPGMAYERFPAAGGQGLLMSANGTGRVLLLRDGLKYDLTGPAVSPEAAMRLARLL